MIETLLKVHRDAETIDFKSIWQDGIFIFDSNVLLDLYRLPESASNDLIEVLKNKDFNNRIWIGFQVILEFLNNRYETIGDQKNKFSTVRTLLEDAISQYEEVFAKLSSELSKLKLKQRHSLIDPDKFINSDNISNGKRILKDFIDELSVLESKQSDVNDDDNIKKLVLEIFDGKIGEGFTKEELEGIYKAGEKRYENNIPPGYKDKTKKGSYVVGDKEYIRQFGDLILWKEIIRKAKDKNISHIILVTGDVKEDWWLEKRGKKLGARKELLNEIYMEAPELKTFYLYDTSSFLKHAKSELNLSISDSSISQAKDLIERSRRDRFVDEEGFIYLPEVIKSVASKISGFDVLFNKSVTRLPALKISEMAIYTALMEIFQNASEHGIENFVAVGVEDRENTIDLRFRNPREQKDDFLSIQGQNERTVSSFGRGFGLESVRKVMFNEGIDVHVFETPHNFTVDLCIPKSKFYGESEAQRHEWAVSVINQPFPSTS
jgi:hypothetical protein